MASILGHGPYMKNRRRVPLYEENHLLLADFFRKDKTTLLGTLFVTIISLNKIVGLLGSGVWCMTSVDCEFL